MNPLYIYIKQKLIAASYAETEASALARWILEEEFGFSTLELYAGKDTDFPMEKRNRLNDILVRLARFEPIQYIIGKTEFCGLTLKVSSDVLIPRPETAELVDWIVSDCPQSGLRVLDIGTGSGCIAITLAGRMVEAEVSAWDISEKALAVARENALHNNVRIAFSCMDVFNEPTDISVFDIIVSNPPYITESERAEMERNVLDYEPETALFVPDTDPLRFYRRIAHIGNQMLKPGGKLFFEINRAYGSETAAMLKYGGYSQVEVRSDSYGNARMIKAIKR
ncbi:peptide chain release factor N(5)-glutamine methyltransferase [Bacteroides caecicola]|uniref:peptide chain release factor N(5)-glutamine methyltransferase n=1 Tax=Bacteroides caecicola TaxID=1462569 RepID=UPI0020115E1E|nr:peptide chain release factor N(5)-glutamine methyltransferase [Bacteroides caecicola]MCL1627062.1 peptide chain release factor N(5)-glutamine methyltransferase [Bacteroides caecicola]